MRLADEELPGAGERQPCNRIRCEQIVLREQLAPPVAAACSGDWKDVLRKSAVRFFLSPGLRSRCTRSALCTRDSYLQVTYVQYG